MPRILLAGELAAEAEAKLAAAGEVVRVPARDEAALCAQVVTCDALVARTHTPVTRAVLSAGDRLRVVGIAGVGLDHVDVAAADECGIAVLHTPGAATEAVAELTLGLILQLLRPIPRLQKAYLAGRFVEARARPHGAELHELTIGIVGIGRIGSTVARICAAGFGARVLYNDIADVGPFDFDATSVDKGALWRDSDIVTLHVPLTGQTRGLISANVLAQMRPTALLINTARGAVVDTAALVAALAEQRIAGVALDVTDPEPLPTDHPLHDSERCIITPHIAARTPRGWRRMCAVVDQVIAHLESALG
jgi:D-3-phosphoglycerate dehydrogenase